MVSQRKGGHLGRRSYNCCVTTYVTCFFPCQCDFNGGLKCWHWIDWNLLKHFISVALWHHSLLEKAQHPPKGQDKAVWLPSRFFFSLDFHRTERKLCSSLHSWHSHLVLNKPLIQSSSRFLSDTTYAARMSCLYSVADWYLMNTWTKRMNFIQPFYCTSSHSRFQDHLGFRHLTLYISTSGRRP